MGIAKVRHIIHTKHIYRKRAAGIVLPIAALFLANTALAGGSDQITNLSSRTYVGPGDSATITGFTISGAAQTVVVRAIGPTLAQFGIANWLVDPTLELHAANGAVIATNDNWADTQTSLFRAGGAYAAFHPPSEMESAMAMTLQPGAYTAVVRGKNGATGVALAEVYAASNDPSSTLANVSSRALVGIGENVLIGGLIIANDNADFVLRALGPSLAQFGIINPLADPLLELYDSNGHLIRQDDNWADDPQQAAQIEAYGFAPASRLEPAMAITLSPGSYTAVVRGNNNTTGVALFETYHLSQPAPTAPVVPHGVFCLVRAGGNIDSAVLANPSVDGISIRQKWSDLEPSDGVYNWNYFDMEIARAAAAGKPVLLRVATGGPGAIVGHGSTFAGDKPDWLINAIIAADGKFFSYIDPDGTANIPVFWDPTLNAKKKEMIATLGARYAGNPAVKIVAVAYANASTEDWNVPDRSLPDGLPPSGSSTVSRWLGAGYTSRKMIDTGIAIIDAAANAFPHQIVTMAIGSNNNTVALDPNGREYVHNTVAAEARRKYPGRILVQKNNLCAKVAAAPGIGTAFQTLWENQPNAAQMLWFCYGDSTYRNNGGIPIDPTNCLRQSIDTGVSYGTKFIEIYQVDVLNLRTVIDYAHSVL